MQSTSSDNPSIGTPGQPWGPAEVAEWRATRRIQRSYADLVVSAVQALSETCEIVQYGTLEYDQHYPLYAIRSRPFDPAVPNVLITGGVHGYETSGVHGALQFAAEHMAQFTSRFNFTVLPCISPWGYETVNRWNPMAVDPNRSFKAGGAALEATEAMAFVHSLGLDWLAHLDLHETTDTDNTEFRPALMARDGREAGPLEEIPDGFYLVGNSRRPALEFHRAIIESVRAVTHIAPPDAAGHILGMPPVQEGVIQFDVVSQGLCGGFTDAAYATTTEVYPDSDGVTAAQCNNAQVAAITGALRYLMKSV